MAWRECPTDIQNAVVQYAAQWMKQPHPSHQTWTVGGFTVKLNAIDLVFAHQRWCVAAAHPNAAGDPTKKLWTKSQARIRNQFSTGNDRPSGVHRLPAPVVLIALRAQQAGALGEAMTAAEARHGHAAAMMAFDVFDRLKRDALRAQAEAMAGWAGVGCDSDRPPNNRDLL
jgi:hypothetical protein